MSSSPDICSSCDESFSNKYDRYAHDCGVPDEEYRPYAKRRDELLKDVTVPDSERCLYVLLLQRNSDGKEFFYVGETSSFVNRTHSHIRDADIRMISADGSHFTEDYHIKKVVEIEPIDVRGKAEATYLEREKAYKIALEHNTTAVLGGR